jgi:hypothetical protein
MEQYGRSARAASVQLYVYDIFFRRHCERSLLERFQHVPTEHRAQRGRARQLKSKSPMKGRVFIYFQFSGTDRPARRRPAAAANRCAGRARGGRPVTGARCKNDRDSTTGGAVRAGCGTVGRVTGEPEAGTRRCQQTRPGGMSS